LANCRACTAELPKGVAACPACDEPVAGYPKKTEEKPPEEARDSDKKKPDTMPSNDAMLSLTAGIASAVLALLPCILPTFLGVPAAAVPLACAAFAIKKGTEELKAIEAGTSPKVGEKPANNGRLAGFVGGGLTALTLVASLAWTFVLAGFFHKHR
jgi:hypothetical protein